MASSAAVWLVVLVSVIAANLPFVNERVLIVGPKRGRKSLGWRLLELALMWGITLGIGFALEARLGQIQAQRWEFYVGFGFLFLTLAFPGFVWRYLMKHR
jgi:hypothetical protein